MPSPGTPNGNSRRATMAYAAATLATVEAHLSIAPKHLEGPSGMRRAAPVEALMMRSASMYLPPHFAIEDVDEMQAAVRRIGIGTLITFGEELEASLVPLVLDVPVEKGLGILRGHHARPNPQLGRRRTDVRALAVFQGPAHYITPAWYETKRRTGKVVPTYDYVVVQARGYIRTIDDRARVRDHLVALTAHHEASVASGWRMSDAPAEYMEAMLNGIVAFEMPIDELVGKWKLSQNRPDDDIDGVVGGLTEVGKPAACDVAELVTRFRPAR